MNPLHVGIILQLTPSQYMKDIGQMIYVIEQKNGENAIIPTQDMGLDLINETNHNNVYGQRLKPRLTEILKIMRFSKVGREFRSCQDLSKS